MRWPKAMAASCALLALSLGGCGDAPKKAAKAPAPTPKIEAPKAAALEESEHDALVVEYTYQPVGKRDPFRPFYDSFEPVLARGDVDSKCGPLCQWELDQLRLVAVVSGVASPLAMVEDPEGRGHMVRRGSAIGKRSGKVSQIRRDRVVVTELLRNKQGQVIPVELEMPLRTQDAKDRAGKTEALDLSMSDGR